MAVKVFVTVEVAMDRKMAGTAAITAVNLTDNHAEVLVPTIVASGVLHVIAQAPSHWA